MVAGRGKIGARVQAQIHKIKSGVHRKRQFRTSCALFAAAQSSLSRKGRVELIDYKCRVFPGLVPLITACLLPSCQTVHGEADALASEPEARAASATESESTEGDKINSPSESKPEQAVTQQRSSDGVSAQDRILSRLSAHEPLYFAVGFNERTNAKFQYSFAYSFLNPEGELVTGTPWLEGIHFGFSQTTIWDLQSESAPFLDSTYRPALFWRDQKIERWSREGLSIGMETGIEHESNGKGGVDSRSVNIAYAKPSWNWRLPSDLRIAVEPKIWAYLGESSGNSDIEDFRGNFNLRLRAYRDDGFGISSDIRIGRDSDHGYLQVDWTYPLRKLLSDDFEGFLFVQYFNGWGESIIVYDQKTPSQVRIGFALIR